MSDGKVDTSYNPNANGTVYSIIIQGDGYTLVGGSFTTISGVTRESIASMNTSGELDSGFHPSINGSVRTMVQQTDGKIIIGGNFTTINGVARNYLAMLYKNGALNLEYNPDPDGSILALSIQKDGKHLAGGTFEAVSHYLKNYICRIKPDVPANQELSIDPEGETITWYRTGSGPEVWDVVFEQSLDGINFTPFWGGSRITNGWQLDNLDLPKNQNLFIRARGFSKTGGNNGSASIVETVKNVFLEEETVEENHLIFLPLLTK
jgi:hypothetical protein